MSIEFDYWSFLILDWNTSRHRQSLQYGHEQGKYLIPSVLSGRKAAYNSSPKQKEDSKPTYLLNPEHSITITKYEINAEMTLLYKFNLLRCRLAAGKVLGSSFKIKRLVPKVYVSI